MCHYKMLNYIDEKGITNAHVTTTRRKYDEIEDDKRDELEKKLNKKQGPIMRKIYF